MKPSGSEDAVASKSTAKGTSPLLGVMTKLAVGGWLLASAEIVVPATPVSPSAAVTVRRTEKSPLLV